MKTNVLVTGAAGFLGSWTTRRLREASYRVVATDRVVGTSAAGPLLVGDLNDEAFVARLATAGPFDTIVHFSWPAPRLDDTSLNDPTQVEPVVTVIRLLELARAHGASFIFPSTTLLYGSQGAPFREQMELQPATPYAFSKAVGELAIAYHGRRYGQPFTILRPGVVYGPGQQGRMFIPSLVRALVAGEPFPMTGGEQLRDFLFVDDLARLVVRAVEARSRTAVVNASGGGGTRLREVAELAERVAGVHGLVAPGAVPYREQEIWDYSLDGLRAQELFDWTPQTPLAAGLLLTIEAERARHGMQRMAAC